MTYNKSLDVITTDPQMAKIVKSIGEITLEPQNLPMFQTLVHSIISQQLSKKAASMIFYRFLKIFPESKFPVPEQVCIIDIKLLREAGLSNAKAIYVKGLAEAVREGFVPSLETCSSLADSEIIRLLTKIKGIGTWSAQMALIFNLARPDVLPSSDAGLRRAFSLMYLNGNVVSNEQLEIQSRLWQPYRTMASLYLWAALDSGLILPSSFS